jgi:hypothetical protein
VFLILRFQRCCNGDSGVVLGVIRAIFYERFPDLLEPTNRRANWGSGGNGSACAFVVFFLFLCLCLVVVNVAAMLFV